MRSEALAIEPWVLATRPKTLTAAIVPVMVGTVLAWQAVDKIEWSLSVYALLVAIFIQIGTNLVNDALDFKKGADTKARIGPMRVTQMGFLSFQQVLMGGLTCFGLALLFGIPLMIQGGFPISLFLAISVLLGYLYTGGPFPLAYCGLGDLFVLLFFGLASTGAVFYVHTGEVTAGALLAGTQIGLLATVMIAINNLRDIDEDTLADKKTLAVRFGKTFARWEITLTALIPFVLSLLWVWEGRGMVTLCTSLTFPLAFLLARYIWRVEPSPRYNQFLGLSALLHLLFGVLLIFGLVIT